MRSNRENIVFFLLTLAGVIVSTAFFTSTTGQMQIRHLLARTNNTGGQLATPTSSTGGQINTPTSSTGGYAAVPTNQIDQKKIDDLTALANTYLEKGNGVIIGVQSFRNENENVYVLVFQPKGQMDEKGDTDAQGLMGDKGDAGVQGLKGDTGAKGDKGDTGTKGDTGDKGDKGDAGTKGDTGAIGSQGLKGDKAKADELTAQLATAKADALKAETDAKAKADELSAQVETLTTQLEIAKADALTVETKTKARADELSAQVETLTTQLETAKADALKAETDAKAKADELTTQLETAKADALKAETDAKAKADELTTQLATAKADALTVETKTKARADELSAQVETLTTQLATAKADALKAETDAKTKADKLTAQVETLTAQLATAKADALTAETDAKAKADELTAQVENLNTQLATAKADAMAAETDAKAKADELTEQIVSLTSEFNTAKVEFDGKATEQEKTFAQLKAKLAESEINRLELQRKVYALTVDANYRNNTVCTFGLHLRDIAPELTDKWYTVTPIDLSKNGTQSFELVGGNMWIIGQVNVTVDGDSVLVDQDIILEGIGRTKIQSEYLNIFNDLNSIKPEALEGDGLDGMGYRFGEPISIEKDLGGDTNVLLYVRNVATFHTHVSPGRVLVRMGENLPDRIKRRNAMIEMMDPMMNEEVPTARGD